MTTLAVAYLTAALADDTEFAQAPTGCENSWMCPGASNYCYPDANFNHCAIGDGIGAICEIDDDCGWIGEAGSRRKMLCKWRSGTWMKCEDPEQPVPLGRRLNTESTQGTDGSPTPYNPNHEHEGCETAWNCEGTGNYCYPGDMTANYCAFGDGIGSLCENDDGCGWIGSFEDGTRRQTLCEYPGWGEVSYCQDPWNEDQGLLMGGRRLGTRGLPTPYNRPSCETAFDCLQDDTYCYPGAYKNTCEQGDGIGSLCQNDRGCGWIGSIADGTRRKMYCSGGFGSGEQRRASGSRGLPSPFNPTNSGYCRDPWQNGNMRVGRRME